MWSTQQILTFAPDAGTAKRGQELATQRKWRNLQGNERAVWGECKSSGASYYLTAVDMNGPAFKCNCPSRKFPCKHSVGLMLLISNNTDAVQITTDYPSWVSEWLEKRDAKNPDKEDDSKSIDNTEAEQKRIEQKNKNRDKRLAQMQVGLNDLEIWLTDTIRQGLASTERQSYDFWKDISARMVDAKLGGIGKRIQSMQLLQGGNITWVDKMLAQLTDLYLVVKGFKNLEKLSPPLQVELLSIAGINTKKDEVLALKGVKDEWIVMGQIEGIEDNLNFRRVWLQGQKTKQFALILDFVFGDIGFPNHYPTGNTLKGELCFYPSAFPLRAILKMPFEISNESKSLQGFSDFRSFTEAYSNAIVSNPWLLDFPAYFEKVTPIIKKDELFIIDENNQQLKVIHRNQIGWKLLAISGGYPIQIFGEWTGDIFIPLSAEAEGRLVVF